MQALQLRPRLHGKLTSQPGAQIPEHPQRVSLPPGPVPGNHQQPGQPLRQRMPGQHQRNLLSSLPIPAGRQQAAEPVLDSGQLFLRQPRPDRFDPRSTRDIGQRRAPPQRQGLTEHLDRITPVRCFPR